MDCQSVFKEGADFVSQPLRVSTEIIWGFIVGTLAPVSPHFTRNSKQVKSASKYIVVPIALTSKILVLSL